MTRIISGTAGGTVLSLPAAGTRPTSDRVRESLFASLEAQDALDGARVADLYAGSGALGLESLSRGAARVDLVDSAAAACRVASANAAKVARALGGQPVVRVHQRPVLTYLAADAAEYDLVFIDPPYALADAQIAAVLALLAPRLAPDAVVVLERASRSADPTLPEGLVQRRHRRYGDTALWWLGPGQD